MSKKEKKVSCNICGKKFPESQIIYGPDPYDSEINEDYTEVSLCRDCYDNQCMEI